MGRGTWEPRQFLVPHSILLSFSFSSSSNATTNRSRGARRSERLSLQLSRTNKLYVLPKTPVIFLVPPSQPQQQPQPSIQQPKLYMGMCLTTSIALQGATPSLQNISP